MGSCNRTNKRCGRSHRLEALSPRVLLSAAFDQGVLTLVGTESADDISLTVDPRFINVLDARINGDTSYYLLTSVTEIHIAALDGDDRVTIDPILDVLNYRASVEGGAGNDRITTGPGNDTIDAGSGADKIYSNGGNDLVIAGSGNDSVYTGAGNDTIYGNKGNDRIVTEDGNDVCVVSKGNNFVDTGSGDDVIKSAGGTITAYAGAGNDSGSLKSAGILYAQSGDDIFVSTGGALLYGGYGADNLQGSTVWGEADNDTLSGLLVADEIHGGGGDDLIRGFSGEDTLFGDEGGDAIFGGGDNDTLYGGAGDDNLYGTDGHLDKHPELAGRDWGYGEAGMDWFETGYAWAGGDRSGADDRPPATQVVLIQDPSYGHYTSSGASLNISAGTIDFGGGTWVPIMDTVDTDPLGKIGWISEGEFGTDGKRIPPTLTRAQRLAVKSGILQLPHDWVLGDITSAGDGVVWYRVYDPVHPDVVSTSSLGARPITLTGGAIYNISSNTTWVLSGVTGPISTNLGYIYPVSAADAAHVLPTPTGSESTPPETTLSDATVAGGKWRFVAVKRGTVLIDDAGHDALIPVPMGLETPILPITSQADFQLAGGTTIYHTANSFDSLPTDGPVGAHGLALDHGVIWLPMDGSAPYFDAGN